MKEGRTLEALATEIQRQRDSKRDFRVPYSHMTMCPPRDTNVIVGGSGDGLRLALLGKDDTSEEFFIRDTFHDQVSQRLGIPRAYYRKMQEEIPDLLCENVNSWLGKTPTTERLVRTLDGSARALLSNRYRLLDNDDFAEAVLPVLQGAGAEVESCEITERRLYIQAVTGRFEGKVVGDIVRAGVCISNSEIGCGALQVKPLIFTLACRNGMIVEDRRLQRRHLGRRLEADSDGEWEVFSDKTRELSDRAIWSQVQNVTKAALDEVVFMSTVRKLQSASENKLEGSVEKAVEEVQNRFLLTDGERGSVLEHLIKGGDLSQYGMLNAVTRASQDVKEYDRAIELEQVGGRILELPKRDWEAISKVS